MESFNRQAYVDNVKKKYNITDDEEFLFRARHVNYATRAYVIPITVLTEPIPYRQVRVNPRTMTMYVPDKQKMVANIRDLMLSELGPDCFLNGFFPRFTETIVRARFYIPTPKSFSREAKYLAECGILRPIVIPDTDNIEKIVNDAIKSFIIYDDAQIVTDITEKFYSEVPRYEFEVIYNASPLEIVHKNTIKQRREKWKTILENKEHPAPVIHHLKKYFNTLT